MSGWIKIHRKLLTWEWYDDHNTTRLFLHLLLSANYKATKWRGRTIEVGQVLTGRNKLSNDTGISTQSVRTSLDKLKSTNEIAIESTMKYSIITIINYASYQEIEIDINQQINHLTNQLPTNCQPSTNHIQEIKNIKNVKNIRNKGVVIRSVDDIPNYQNIDLNYDKPLNEWLSYKAEIGKGYKSVKAIRSLIKQFPTTEKLEEAVNHSMANNWQGCFAPTSSHSSKPKQTTFERNMGSLERQMQNQDPTILDTFIGDN